MRRSDRASTRAARQPLWYCRPTASPRKRAEHDRNDPLCFFCYVLVFLDIFGHLFLNSSALRRRLVTSLSFWKIKYETSLQTVLSVCLLSIGVAFGVSSSASQCCCAGIHAAVAEHLNSAQQALSITAQQKTPAANCDGPARASSSNSNASRRPLRHETTTAFLHSRLPCALHSDLPWLWPSYNTGCINARGRGPSVEERPAFPPWRCQPHRPQREREPEPGGDSASHSQQISAPSKAASAMCPMPASAARCRGPALQ